MIAEHRVERFHLLVGEEFHQRVMRRRVEIQNFFDIQIDLLEAGAMLGAHGVALLRNGEARSHLLHGLRTFAERHQDNSTLRV